MNASPVPAWHQLVTGRNAAGIEALLADDAVFYSPVVHTPQVGKPITFKYLASAFDVLFNPTFRYTQEIEGPRDAMLEFETVIDGLTVNGVDIIRWNDAGLITEFKVMLRPLKAVTLVHQRMGAMLQAAQQQKQ